MRLKFQRYFLFIATLVLWSFLTPAVAQTSADNVIIDMAQAYRKADRRSLEALLPRAKGHLLEPWAAYWTLKARLNEATEAEVQAFLQRYAGTYQETIVKALTAHKSGKPPATSVLLSTDMFTLIDEDAIVPIDSFAKTAEDKAWLESFYPWRTQTDGQGRC